MQRRQLGNLELSTPLLGFGTMRLPLQEDKKTVDFEQVQQMVDCAMENGVNYFDTAYPYHDGTSEENVGRAPGQLHPGGQAAHLGLQREGGHAEGL